MKNDKILIIFLKNILFFYLRYSSPAWDYNVLIDAISFLKNFIPNTIF